MYRLCPQHPEPDFPLSKNYLPFLLRAWKGGLPTFSTNPAGVVQLITSGNPATGLWMPIYPVNKKFFWSFVCTLYLNVVAYTYLKKSPAHVFHLRMRQCVSWLTRLCSSTHCLLTRSLQIEQVIICWRKIIMRPGISTLFKNK